MRLSILKISQDNPQNNFLNFLTSQKHFHNLKIFRKYPWNDFETDIRGMFLEYSENICDYWNLPKDQHLLLSNHTLLTQKQLFPSRTL